MLYINGNGTYSYHSYRGLGGGLLNLNDASSSDLQPTSTTATTQHCIPGTTNAQSPSSSGPTDLSMKRQLASSSGSSSSSSSRPQLSPTEINAVRQLVAGYRESAAFLLRSADELENLILQQNWVMWPSHRPGLISEFPLMTFWFPRAHTSVTAQSFRRVNYHNATLFLIHKVMC